MFFHFHRIIAAALLLLCAPMSEVAAASDIDNYLIMSVPKLRQIVYVVINRDTTMRPLVIDKIISPKGIAVDK